VEETAATDSHAEDLKAEPTRPKKEMCPWDEVRGKQFETAERIKHTKKEVRDPSRLEQR